VLRTTAISPGYICTELAGSMSDPVVQEQIRGSMDALGIPAEAVARTIAFAIEQPANGCRRLSRGSDSRTPGG
jgi:NADP-dependent 3-hydroxy acid dehydrogenase YdfG